MIYYQQGVLCNTPGIVILSWVMSIVGVTSWVMSIEVAGRVNIITQEIASLPG